MRNLYLSLNIMLKYLPSTNQLNEKIQSIEKEKLQILKIKKQKKSIKT